MKKTLLFISTALVLLACNSEDKKSEAPLTDNSANPLELPDTSKKMIPDGATSTQSEKIDTSNFTTIEWIDNISQSLPKIKEGEVIEITYRFRNTGTKPLVILDVTASCGCTVPEKPKEPIMPGKEGRIKAKFDSNGKPGTNTKNLTVLANTNGDKILTFTVDVVN